MLDTPRSDGTDAVPEVHSSTMPLMRYGIGAGVIAIAVVIAGVVVRGNAEHELKTVTADAAVPTVAVVEPKQSTASGTLTLPGDVQAYNAAPIYARTNGYVRRWLVDIGDPVRAGQTLAILDAPEIEQQLAQAEADYQTARANQSLAQTTAKRWSEMLAQDAVSRQESDEKAGDLAAKTAVTNAALANVRRLRALQGFTRLTAPFNGVVTSRSAQIGALVTAGNAAAQPLFTVADVHRMRIYVRVPQGYSSTVHIGEHATLTLPEYAGRSFDAVMTRSADAVDPKSGTMLIELQADNGDGTLKPGSYAQVRLAIPATTNTLTLPSSALIYGSDGPTVAIVGKDGVVTLRKISLGRDNGATVEVTAGLKADDKVVDSPPDAISTGDHVRIQTPKAAANAKG